ncbi:MAG: hypothetical protein IT384_13500 [Deltaproteobacteria bacterium]|nr:hypothetical protein [Deltaproteobacteria bacterium]
MEKRIKNDWRRPAGAPYTTALILSEEHGPEGLRAERTRFLEPGRIDVSERLGRLLSVIRGPVTMRIEGATVGPLTLDAGVHLYLPPDLSCSLDASAGAELVRVTAPSPAQARGEKLLLRDEEFLAACASGTLSTRWLLTPHYLSRRIFLHHDRTLLSKSGHPVSWFRTTMFDVLGLPHSEEGEPVFKMSYNSRTEFNICYEVSGIARVRMARHPYREVGQPWDPWRTIDGESAYHLNEAAGGPEEERRVDPAGGGVHPLRNKHEFYAEGGSASMFCLFDPAPTGIERHQPGEYSDYEPLAQVTSRPEYARFQQEVGRFDEMVDALSRAKAEGRLRDLEGTPLWERFLAGRRAQAVIEAELIEALRREGHGPDREVARWMQPPLK